MRTIDLNADLGELEDGSLDAAVMPHLSSANIACGAHAGNPEVMRRTVRLAKQHSVSIGAHPGYPDSENFGRVSIELSIENLCRIVCEQIELLSAMAKEEGVYLRHVKLHGALYNDLSDDYDRSLALCRAIACIAPDLRLIGFSGSATLRAAEDAGLIAVHEVFADRAYTADGKLVPRSQAGAVIHDEAACLAQVERMVSAQNSDLLADSICVHGDNPSAVAFVSRLRAFFEQRGIAVQPAGDLQFRFTPLGESVLLAQLPPRISKSTHRAIRALQLAVEQHKIQGVLELVPCYAELKIDFDASVITYEQLMGHLQCLADSLDTIELPPARIIEVPVCYESPYAPDLADVAEHAGLSEQEVVRRHSAPSYLIYMLGFSPGFAYLGGLDSALSMPRLSVPRILVPAGAVGIAGNQTGIYPVETPGGWRIIGRTPLSLFSPDVVNPFLFEPGDEIRFVPISAEAFDALR